MSGSPAPTDPPAPFVVPMPPPPELSAPPVARGSVPAAVQVLGLALTVTGLLGLPLQDRPRQLAASFWRLHELVGTVRRPVTDLAAAWFGSGALIVLAVLAVLIAGAVALPRSAVLAGLTGLTAVLTLAWHLLATSGTGDLLRFRQSFTRSGSTWDHPGSGVWLGLAGPLVILLGVGLTLLRRRR